MIPRLVYSRSPRQLAARLFFFSTILISIAVLLATPARTWHSTAISPAATIIVTNTNDSGAGSLRQAISSAASGDTITFAIPTSDPGYDSAAGKYTITLTTAELTIATNLTITGPGANQLTISGNNHSRVFNINTSSAIAVNISGVTMSNGTAPNGGGIFINGSYGTINLSSCVISNNSSGANVSPNNDNGSGGGIYSYGGTLNLTNSTLSNNSALNHGGGIYAGSNGNLNLTNTNVSNNTAGTTLVKADGGGILIRTGSLKVIDSTISSNFASDYGGGILNNGPHTLTNSTVSNNSGGGIYNSNNLTVTNSTIANNSTHGGIYNNDSAVINMTGSTVSHNSSNLDGGAIYNGKNGSVTLTSCTVAENTAQRDGGGIYNFGNLYLYNSTITNNLTSADTSLASNGGGGICNSTYGVTLRNTIVAANFHSTTAIADDIVLISGATVKTANSFYNLIGTGGSGGLTTGVNGNLVGVSDPKLGALQANGGRTLTCALLAGSPAIDKGDPSSTLTTDQRGGFRPVDGDGDGANFIDIGAFEYGVDLNAVRTATSMALSSSPNPSSSYQPVTFTATVTSAAGTPTGSVQFRIDGLNSGAPAIVNASGVATLTTSALTLGTHTVTANYSGSQYYLASSATLSGDQVVINAVINTNDSGAGSLRQAISNAASGSTITFAIPTSDPGYDSATGKYTITLTSAELVITRPLTITGPGANQLTISGNNHSRVFNLNIYQYGVTVSISGVTISSGLANRGGGIYIGGYYYYYNTLNLTDCIISNNSTAANVTRFDDNGSGGGIYSATGNLNLTNTTVSNNSAVNNAGGIYMYYSGSLSLTNTTVSNNTAGSTLVNAEGGGIVSRATTFKVTDSTISNNSASDYGGGIASYGQQTTVITSTVSNNSGGGIYSASGLTITNSTIANNSTHGGIYIASAMPTTITGSTISNNSSTLDGGGIYNNGGVTLTNCTVAGNTAQRDGGGIYTVGNLYLYNSTITNNLASADTSLASHGGGGICNSYNSLTLSNTIVAANSHGAPATADDILLIGGGTVKTANSFYNLIGTGGSGGLTTGVNGNLVGVSDPKLGALQNNGGPTLTCAPLAGSPAIDKGDPSGAITTDQRGGFRPVDGDGDGANFIDIGACEFGVDLNAVRVATDMTVSSSPNPSDPYQPVTFTATVTSAAAMPTGSVQFTIDGANSGAPAVLNATGVATLTAPLVTVGTHTVTANYSGDQYHLTSSATLPGGQVIKHGTVTNTKDSGAGSLRDEIFSAGWGNTIAFAIPTSDPGYNSATGKYTITLNTPLAVSRDLTIIGPGANQLTISGNNRTGVFTISTSWPLLLKVNISGVTISNGTATRGGGIYISGNAGTINLTNCIVSNNSAVSGIVPYLSNGSGGGIYDEGGTLNLTNTTVSNNSAALHGGGIYVGYTGILNLTSATVSNNTAGSTVVKAEGGGILTGTDSQLTVTDSTISNNSASDFGGGIFNLGSHTLINSNVSNNSGGGIYNSNFLTVTNSTVSSNSIHGGIYNNSGTVLNMTRSTVANNSSALEGGGIYNGDNAGVTLTNCTVSYNTAQTDGGGIYNGGNLYLNNSTIIDNLASASTSLASNGGGGICNSKYSVTLHNTIVAENSHGAPAIADDILLILGATVKTADSRNNLIGVGGSGGLIDGVNGNQVGVDPKMGDLQDNGGPTLTCALLAGSPAIDKGDPLSTLTTDQRGVTRPADGDGDATALIDIGAVEFVPNEVPNLATNTLSSSANPSSLNQPVTFTATVTSATGTPTGRVQFTIDGANSGAPLVLNATGVATLTTSALALGTHTVTANYSGDHNYAASSATLPGGQVVKHGTVTNTNDSGTGSLRDEILNAAWGDTIIFAVPTSDPGYDSATSRYTITLNTQLTITRDLTIMGPGANQLVISGNNRTGVFAISTSWPATLKVNLSGLAISNGTATRGGGIYISGDAGTINLTNCTVSNNAAVSNFIDYSSNGSGGGIYSEGGTLNLTNVTLANNSAALHGGGIYIGYAGNLNLTSATVSDNTAGSTLVKAEGGGILSGANSHLTVTDSTISNNSASDFGGGIFNLGSHALIHSAVSNNTGGGIYNSNFLTVTDSTIANNTIHGGIYNNSGTVLNMAGTTVSNNSSSLEGGGIYNGDKGGVTLTNCTVAYNTAQTDGGGIYNGGNLYLTNTTITDNLASANTSLVSNGGGGICNSNYSLTLRNTIVAGNFHGAPATTDDILLISSATVKTADSFNNLIGTGGSGGLVDGLNGNQVGVSDPKVGDLQDNGGPTLTCALLAGSPAIDKGDPTSTLTTDQCGATRPTDGDGDGTAVIDIGAFEYVPNEAPPTTSALTVGTHTGGQVINNRKTILTSHWLAGLVPSLFSFLGS
jgi:parallel beta-helix repeat protein